MKQNVYTVGIDLAKKIFHLVGTDTTRKIVWRKRLTRHVLVPFIAQLPPVTIGLEACGTHYWARQFHQLRTDRQTDGAAVCEALREVEQKRYA
jgi:transposase